MKLKLRFFTPVSVALLLGLLSLPVSSVHADMHETTVPVSDADREMLPTTADLAVQASNNGEFTILVAALQAADLVGVFDGDAHYTVFAPTDAAFMAIPQETLEAVGLNAVTDLLLEENKALLTSILLFHVTVGDWYAANLPTGVLRMLDGNLAGVYWEGEDLKIEGASIAGEVVTNNGVVHVIEAVILPPLQ